MYVTPNHNYKYCMQILSPCIQYKVDLFCTITDLLPRDFAVIGRRLTRVLTSLISKFWNTVTQPSRTTSLGCNAGIVFLDVVAIVTLDIFNERTPTSLTFVTPNNVPLSIFHYHTRHTALYTLNIQRFFGISMPCFTFPWSAWTKFDSTFYFSSNVYEQTRLTTS